ncbi:MAG: serine hydrolase [Planctomycetes bacterium]|nr:serine hydrolase [Planctomycetota bacterium]
MTTCHLSRRRVLSLALALPLLALSVRAQDDRENSTPTGAIWDNSINPTDLGNLTNSGWRITNLKVVSISSGVPTFAAALVANSGSYNKGWAWYYGQTEAQVRSLLSANNARPIDIEPYLDAGALRYAVVMVANTGADQKPWWWVTGQSTTGVNNAVTANSARIYDLDRYTVSLSTYFSAVLYSNTGSHNRGWWYYYGITGAQLGTNLSTNGARLIDVKRVGSDAYDAVMYSLPDKRWYGLGQSAGQVTDGLMNLGARLVCLDPYTTTVGSITLTTFAVGMTDNLNDEGRRVNDLMRATSDGYVGGYLKRANSSVLIAFNEPRGFEPASTLKTLHHVMTMRRVSLGTYSLGQNVTVNTSMSGSCPTDSNPVGETLEVVLAKMMNDSDNARTKAITTLLGGGNATAGLTYLTNSAAALGMTGTDVNHHIGCGTPANVTTLVDLGKLHEQVINGYLGAQRQKFYDIMMNTYQGGGYALGRLGTVVDQEAASVGLSASQEAAFRSYFFIAGKRGGYGVDSRYHHTWAGYFRVPFYSVTQGVSFQEYVGGAFCGTATNDANANDAAAIGAAEILRERVRASMLTFKNYTGGVVAYFGTSCAGTAGTPSHSVSGSGRIGDTSTWALTGARANTPAVIYFGASNTAWGATPLPLSLAFLGAGTCALRVAPTVGVNGATNASGQHSLTLNVPASASIIGDTLYTQYLFLDVGANALGLVTTRGAGLTFGSVAP